jgi:RNA polymerase sigma-70 factor (ECF subfamily)
MRSDPDRQLVDRTLAGDLSAFEALVDRHQPVVHRVAARVVGPEEAQDVSQDSFLRAFNRLDRFRGESPFRAWLLQITHNTAINALARRRDEPVAETEEMEGERHGGSGRFEREPAASLEESERRRRLELKLTQLRPEHRAVLVLRDVEGLAYDEIAGVTESPVGSVKGRLHRARRELIDILRANTYDWELPGDDER